MIKRYTVSEALKLAAFHIGQKLSEYRSFAQSTHAAIDANQDDPDLALMLQRDAAAYDANAEVFSQALEAIADRRTLAAQAAVYRDALQLIAYTSSNPGNQGNELTHAERWLQKAGQAREALESTTAGQPLLDRQRELEERNKALEALCLRAAGVLGFHAGRCPLDPAHNYSGSESHLSEYRHVQKDIKALLEQKGVEPR